MKNNDQNTAGDFSSDKDSGFEAKIDNLFTLISSAKHCVALTGAGVSTLSGIRDFRGKNGLYKEMDAEMIFDINVFNSDPSFYYKAAGDFIYNLGDKSASIVHTTLGKMEERGKLRCVITQNIDLLHQKGGTKNIFEVHGSPSIHYCQRCSDLREVEDLAVAKPSGALHRDDLMGIDEVLAITSRGDMPRCKRCAKVLKPAITFFGESLPAKVLAGAAENAEKADVLLILGTSLTVYPAAALPQTTVRNGGKLVIVNNMPTGMDRYAALKFDELEPVFTALNDRLDR